MSGRVARAQCANCTCSPGLLSRTSRKSALIARRINLNRLNSGTASNPGSRKGSVFTLNPTLCLPEAKEVNTSGRLESLRKEMKKHDLGVYIVPSEDQHQSEYVSPYDQKRSFISGFSGSAGIAIITRDLNSVGETFEGTAALSTDGRYFTQAVNELDFNWILLKQGAKDEPNWKEWTVKQAIQLSLDSGADVKIGVDARLITYKLYQEIQSLITKELAKTPKAKAELVPVAENLVDNIWEKFEELPASSLGKISKLDISFTGKSVEDKLQEVRKQIKDDIGGIVVSSLDEIAWLLNLRGSDIEYNPVFYSFVILTPDTATLYIGKDRLSEDIVESLQKAGVSIESYDSFYSSLSTISQKIAESNKKTFVPDNANWEVVRNLKSQFSQGLSPVEDLKAIKNQTELEGAKIAHLKDGRALIKFFAWLEDQVIDKQELIDEIEADEKLTEFRKEEDNFVGLSFATISASGANGAVIHYKPEKGQCITINPSKMYLNDSGSQFLEGTTDTTRTVHFDTPTKDEIRNYTLVLKGNVALSTLKFPENTTGNLIDSIARQYLWKYGLNYAHGTSHGVGAYLNVHEGPIGIGPRPNAAAYALKAGNLISNEPGYYQEGDYGIRIENMMFIKESNLQSNGKTFLEFETVTKVPYCRRLIDVSLLNDEEIAWINEYHAGIWKDLHQSFDKHSITYKWLKRETEPFVK
ncbi:FRA1 putative Xaa-Pro aminopeptidase FRA1 [Candida maltosa Xu316]|uniref:Xaa-Pro aminopeptidase n=1 Tax=Candida maltosa (strain Xu316) TaxID=1245528 RepID=M3HU34_CANMX|nr:hypothetical protein G210_5557 [Candida maltosa Xu316]